MTVYQKEMSVRPSLAELLMVLTVERSKLLKPAELMLSNIPEIIVSPQEARLRHVLSAPTRRPFENTIGIVLIQPIFLSPRLYFPRLW